MSAQNAFMKRAIELAGQSPVRTTPNPPVGAVVVRDGVVIGEGFHIGAGTAHAEVVALHEAGEAARGSTLYVTLEPCNHEGRTPPCTRAIIDSGISHVVFGSTDPNPNVTGGGRQALEEAGIEVTAGVLQPKTDRLIRFFRHHSITGRPWVIGKLASSLDGRTATHTGESKWITGEAARRRSHELRRSVDAILVGVNTVIEDDPQLTIRLPGHESGHDHPVRVVLDSHGRSPIDSQVFQTAEPPRTHLFAVSIPSSRARELERSGVFIHITPSDGSGRVHLGSVLDTLGAMNIQSLLVEGGAEVLGAFHDENLIDELWTFIAPRLIGGAGALGSIAGQGRSTLSDLDLLVDVEIETCAPDFLLRGFVNRNGKEKAAI